MSIRTLPLLALTLIFATLIALPVKAEQGLKIAVCDFQRALLEVEEGKKAKANLEKRYNDKKAQVEKKRDQVQALKDSLDAQKALLTPQALESKQKEFEQSNLEYQQLVLQSQQEMSQMEQELTSGILEKLYAVAEKMGKDQGYSLIIEAQAVVYHADALDITQQVVSVFNTQPK